MADFVNGVAADGLRAVAIEVQQGDLIVVQLFVRVYLNGRIIADTTQFRVRIHRSDSMSRAAARNRRMARSPLLSLPELLCPNATLSAPNSPPLPLPLLPMRSSSRRSADCPESELRIVSLVSACFEIVRIASGAVA